MQLIVESPGMLISDRLHHLIQEKFEHLENTYSRVFRCLVILRKEKSDKNLDHKVDATVTVPGKLLFATESDTSFEAGIQKVVDSLLHQLRKYKDEQLEY